MYFSHCRTEDTKRGHNGLLNQRSAKELDIRRRELALAEQRLALEQQRFQFEVKKYEDSQKDLREERVRGDKQHAAMMQLFCGIIEAIKK